MTQKLVCGIMEIWIHPVTMVDWASKLDAFLQFNDAEVLQDKVTILAEIIEWPAEIDLKRAEEAKERAEERIREHAPGTDMKRAEMSLKRAVARINAINYK